MNINELKDTTNRYGGFAELYNNNRPIPPKIITDIVKMYSKSSSLEVADIGSGTGLSTIIWKDVAKSTIGIEPDDDMRKMAEEHNGFSTVTFKKGLSTDTGLESESVNVVTISQALHWMDIEKTFDEVYRILSTDGVFAVFDCVPPSVDWVVEKEFDLLRMKCTKIVMRNTTDILRNNESTKIDIFKKYGKFKFVKEINVHSVEECTRERLLGAALSQGNIQNALKLDDKVQEYIDRYYEVIKERCEEKFNIVYSYNIRLAIK